VSWEKGALEKRLAAVDLGELNRQEEVANRVFRLQRPFSGWHASSLSQRVGDTFFSVTGVHRVTMALLRGKPYDKNRRMADERYVRERFAALNQNAERLLGAEVVRKLKARSDKPTLLGAVLSLHLRATSHELSFEKRLEEMRLNAELLPKWKAFFSRTEIKKVLPVGFSIKPCFLDEMCMSVGHTEASLWLVLNREDKVSSYGRQEKQVGTIGVHFQKGADGEGPLWMLVRNMQGLPKKYDGGFSQKALGHFKRVLSSDWYSFGVGRAIEFARSVGATEVHGLSPCANPDTPHSDGQTVSHYVQRYRALSFKETKKAKEVRRFSLKL